MELRASSRLDAALLATVSERRRGDAWVGEVRAVPVVGWNAVTSRRRGVERLTWHCTASLERWPNAQHFVIGHSHGGNIAFQAMRDGAVESRMAGVVCLSTPFLCAAPRNLGPVGPIAIWWFPVVVALFCLVPAVQLLPAKFESAAGGVAIILALGTGFFISPWITRFAGTVRSHCAIRTCRRTRFSSSDLR